MKRARKTRAEERRKPMGRGWGLPVHVPENWPPCRLPSLFLSLSLLLFLSPTLSSSLFVNATACVHHEISSVALFKLACIERGRNEKRIGERCKRKKRKKERERARERSGGPSVLRARENKIVKRRSRCDVTNEGLRRGATLASLALSYRDLRRRGGRGASGV